MNPQGFALSPFFLILLPLPTAIAMKAHLAVMTFVGLCGTYQLARDRGARGSVRDCLARCSSPALGSWAGT